MLTVYSKRHKPLATIETDGYRITLRIPESRKVSSHVNTFKSWEVLARYLDWVFGAGKYIVEVENV